MAAAKFRAIDYFRRCERLERKQEEMARDLQSNEAIAVSMAFGPARGLALVDELLAEPSLRAYHLLPSVRGDLLAKLGRFGEAGAEFERAASLTRNAGERGLLLERAADCARGAPPSERTPYVSQHQDAA